MRGWALPRMFDIKLKIQDVMGRWFAGLVRVEERKVFENARERGYWEAGGRAVRGREPADVSAQAALFQAMGWSGDDGQSWKWNLESRDDDGRDWTS